MRRRFLSLVTLAAVIAPVAAQPPAVPPTKLTLRPAAAPDPALKYQLLPELKDLGPGNAALLYQRSHSPEWMGYRREKDYWKKIEEWLKAPLKDLPRDTLQNYAAVSRHMLKELDLAARREQCDWELTQRFRQEHFVMLLPDVQWFREAANLLAVRARLEMAAGKYDEAVYTFQTGFALGRHMNEIPILITNLVGIAIGHTMATRLEEFIQQPGAPNLYWALTSTPRPFFDPRWSFQGEKAAIESLLQQVLAEPTERTSLAGQLGVRGAEQRTVRARLRRLSSEELHALVEDLYAISALVREGPGPAWGRLSTLAAAVKHYPQAREALIARGRKPEEVDALPVLQVVVLDSVHHYRRHRDDLYKWVGLPYPQARAGLDEANQKLAEARWQMECLPALLDLLPAAHKVYFASVRFDRRVAALRCVEALRLHAAGHGGKLPATLSAITGVPVPLDPVTGKEFTYQAAGNKATLYGPPPPGETPAEHNTIHYEITLAR